MNDNIQNIMLPFLTYIERGPLPTINGVIPSNVAL